MCEEAEPKIQRFIGVLLGRQLSCVRRCCEGKPEGEGVSALTSEERTRWAKVPVFTFSLRGTIILDQRGKSLRLLCNSFAEAFKFRLVNI